MSRGGHSLSLFKEGRAGTLTSVYGSPSWVFLRSPGRLLLLGCLTEGQRGLSASSWVIP